MNNLQINEYIENSLLFAPENPPLTWEEITTRDFMIELVSLRKQYGSKPGYSAFNNHHISMRRMLYWKMAWEFVSLRYQHANLVAEHALTSVVYYIQYLIEKLPYFSKSSVHSKQFVRSINFESQMWIIAFKYKTKSVWNTATPRSSEPDKSRQKWHFINQKRNSDTRHLTVNGVISELERQVTSTDTATYDGLQDMIESCLNRIGIIEMIENYRNPERNELQQDNWVPVQNNNIYLWVIDKTSLTTGIGGTTSLTIPLVDSIIRTYYYN